MLILLVCFISVAARAALSHSAFPGPLLPAVPTPLQYPHLMANDSRAMTTSVPLVAIAGWILPGSGYLLIGQRWRGFVTGISIIALFLGGLLIGGVRVIEVPGYKVSNGERQMINLVRMENGHQFVDPNPQWSLVAQPLAEIRDKPWSVPQALAGPMAIAAGAASVWSAGPADPKAIDSTSSRAEPAKSIAPLTHARINELGSLYLSVAGLLNLMVIIDSAWRAHLLVPKTTEEGE
jgi:hypothetical protein